MIIEIFISILLKIIIIFLFIKNQSKNFSFNPPSTNISIYFKKISYLLSDFHSPIFNIQSKIPGKTISLIFLLFFFFQYSTPTIYKIPISKISSSINIAHLSIPPLKYIFQIKKKKKNKKNFQVSPPPPSSSTSKKNEETAQMLLSNRPNSDIQSTYPSNRYFHLSRKILDKPGIQPERETVPTLLNDPGVTAGKARRLSLV